MSAITTYRFEQLTQHFYLKIWAFFLAECNEKGEGDWKAELYHSLGFRVKGPERDLNAAQEMICIVRSHEGC